MQETDAFLTRTIVGAPYSARLGRRLGAQAVAAAGLDVELGPPRSRLARAWDDHLSPARPGRPHRQPGALRRALERHALLIALAGLAALAVGLVLAALGARAWL